MSQAKYASTTSRSSRRSVLAGLSVAAAAGVAALPAGAVAQVAGPSGIDPKLRDLARQFLDLQKELDPVEAASHAAVKRANEETVRRLGFDPHKTAMSDEQRNQVWDVVCEVRNELGTDAMIERCNPIQFRMDAVFKEMMATPIHTLADVGVMSVCAIAVGAISSYWEEPLEDLDWDKKVIRQLVENITAAVGGVSFSEALDRGVRS